MFTRFKRYFLIIALLYCTGNIFAQRADSLKADLKLLLTSIQTLHPAPYTFIARERLEQLYDSCYDQINNDTDDRQFYGIVKIMLSAVRDGHLFSSASPQFATNIHTENTYLPLLTYTTQKGIYIVSSVDTSIPRGSLLVSINSHPAAAVREKLHHYLTSDGFMVTKKDKILDQIFYFYYYMAYGYSAGFTVTYITPSGERKTSALSAVKEEMINAIKPIAEDKPLLSFHITEDKIAILTIGTFAADELKDAKHDYLSFLEQSFLKIKQTGIRKLIIDLRGNGGGRDEYGVKLYSYLSAKPFDYYRSLTENNKPVTAHPGLGKQQPSPLHYDGRLWILTDGNSFSVTSEFCGVAYSNGRATFIGQETGGRYEGNHSGKMEHVTLPYSKTGIIIPTTKYIMAVHPPKYKGRGIIPHLEVQASVDAYMKQEDEVLQAGLHQARSRQ